MQAFKAIVKHDQKGTAMKAQHTPGTATYTNCIKDGYHHHCNLRAGDKVIAEVRYNGFESDAANASRLALCWNCHDELVAVAQALIDYAENNTETNIEPYLVDSARAALAAAKGN